jgi:hypothetical protein
MCWKWPDRQPPPHLLRNVAAAIGLRESAETCETIGEYALALFGTRMMQLIHRSLGPPAFGDKIERPQCGLPRVIGEFCTQASELPS